MLRREKLPQPVPDPPQLDVVAWAMDLGMAAQGGMGLAPLTALEIWAWSEGMGIDLSPWEFYMLRRISRAFVAGSNATEAPIDPKGVRALFASAKMMRQQRHRKIMAG